MFGPRIFGAVSVICILLSCPNSFAAAPAQQGNPFCSDSGCAQTREMLKQMCDYIVAEKATLPTIYVGGYYMRTLVDGYEILNDHRYLDTALAYGDYLLKHQMSKPVGRHVDGASVTPQGLITNDSSAGSGQQQGSGA